MVKPHHNGFNKNQIKSGNVRMCGKQTCCYIKFYKWCEHNFVFCIKQTHLYRAEKQEECPKDT